MKENKNSCCEKRLVRFM